MGDENVSRCILSIYIPVVAGWQAVARYQHVYAAGVSFVVFIHYEIVIL